MKQPKSNFNKPNLTLLFSKPSLGQFKNYFALVTLLAALTGIFDSIHAQAAKQVTEIKFVPPPPPSRGMPSGRQKGAASRGSCQSKDKPLTAIVPATMMDSLPEKTLATRYSVGGLTAAKHPSFWFYIPYTSSNLPIEFVLQDERGINVYKLSLNVVHQQAGLVQISIPSTVASLQIGRVYQWTFIINCTSEGPPFVTGFVRRVAPNLNLQKQLELATLEQSAALYAANGIWYDTLNALAQLRLSNPNEPKLINDWKNLMNVAGISEIADKPINNCCPNEQVSNKALHPVSKHNVRSPKNR